MLKVGGVELHAVADGVGPAVLLLHGNPDTSEMWTPLIARLKQAYRCHAIDLPGFGRSKAPADFDVSVDNQADFILAVLDALGLREPVHLVVHDIGGMYGLAFATKYPDRVRSIGITNTIFQSDYRWHFWGRVWRTRVLGELTNKLATYRLFEREVLKSSRHLAKDSVAATWKRFTPDAKNMVLKLYRAMTPSVWTGWEDRLIALTSGRIPTRVVWGDHDRYIPSANAERFGTRDVHHLSDVGHWVPSEAPERLAPLLVELFARADAPAKHGTLPST